MSLPKHTTTDPACEHHKTPRTRFQQWRFDRNRGFSCPPCFMERAFAEAEREVLELEKKTNEKERTMAQLEHAQVTLKVTSPETPNCSSADGHRYQESLNRDMLYCTRCGTMIHPN